MPSEYVFTARPAASVSRNASSRSRAPTPRRRPGLAGQPPDQHEVLGAGEPLVHRRVLPGQPGELPDLVGMAHHVVAADAGLPAVRPQQGGEDADRSGLAELWTMTFLSGKYAYDYPDQDSRLWHGGKLPSVSI
jgi:hypothetical protein